MNDEYTEITYYEFISRTLKHNQIATIATRSFDGLYNLTWL